MLMVLYQFFYAAVQPLAHRAVVAMVRKCYFFVRESVETHFQDVFISGVEHLVGNVCKN